MLTELDEQGSARLYGPRNAHPEYFSLWQLLRPSTLFSHLLVAKGYKPVPRRMGIVPALFVFGAIFTGIQVGIDSKSANVERTAFEEHLKNERYGAETISEWIDTGGISSTAGREILMRAQKEFFQNLKPLRERAQDFVRYGWWNAETEKITNEILDDLVAKKVPAEIVKKGALMKAFIAHPRFFELASRIPITQAFTLNLLMTPQVVFLDQPDLYWIAKMFGPTGLTEEQKLGLKSLRPFFEADAKSASMVISIELIALTLKSPQIDDKRQKARGFGLPLHTGTFYRADIPPFTGSETFTDRNNNTVTVRDETDRWQLIATDPRLAALAKAWREQTLADQTILLQATLLWRSQIFRYTEAGKTLRHEDACRLIYGDRDNRASPVFENLQQLPDDFPVAVRETLRYELAKIFANSFIRASQNPVAWDQILVEGDQAARTLKERAKSRQFRPTVSRACGNL